MPSLARVSCLLLELWYVVHPERPIAATVYNMYGIRAVDSSPLATGAKFAFEQKWFTPEMAIQDGARWI
ncbi:hypothetical protein, partial [Acinetobacter soli]